jgi:hypothetical protein
MDSKKAEAQQEEQRSKSIKEKMTQVREEIAK